MRWSNVDAQSVAILVLDGQIELIDICAVDIASRASQRKLRIETEVVLNQVASFVSRADTLSVHSLRVKNIGQKRGAVINACRYRVLRAVCNDLASDGSHWRGGASWSSRVLCVRGREDGEK